MTISSDFSAHNYKIIEQLGRNQEGGRFTYKALNIESQQTVIIKQFKFVSSESNWSGYQTVEREVELLKRLSHPQIPKYLDDFESEEGICLVQEYKPAPDLSQYQTFNYDDIKTIAMNVLEILVYLQKQVPLIVHRDLKPENILVDEDFNTYLIDFGLAKINPQKSASTVSGTMGFMPPEQLLNHPLSTASDLYSLGITLISLILSKPSPEIGDLIDYKLQVDLSSIAPKVSTEFLNWLEKMVNSDLKQRFPDAETALQKLKTITIKKPKEIPLNHCEINLKSKKPRAKIEKELSLSTLISEDIHQGRWEVAAHPSDPPHTPDKHTWIKVEPKEFSKVNDEELKCQLKIDTSQLKSEQEYERKLLLHTNSCSETYIIPLRIRTAPFPEPFARFPSYGFLILFVFVGSISSLIYHLKTILWEQLNQLQLWIPLLLNDPRYTFSTNVFAFSGVLIGIAIGMSFWDEEINQEKKLIPVQEIMRMVILPWIYGAIAAIISVITKFVWTKWIVETDPPNIDSLFSLGFFNAYVISDVTLLSVVISFLVGSVYYFYSCLKKAGLTPDSAFLFFVAMISLAVVSGIEVFQYNSVRIVSLIIASSSAVYLVSAIAYLPLAKRKHRKQLKQQESHLINP